MAPDGTGGLLLSWTHITRFTNHVHVVRLGPEGQPAPGWSATGIAVNYFQDQYPSAVCGDGAGGMFVTYVERPYGGTSTMVRHLSGDGSQQTSNPACSVSGSHDSPGIAPDGKGGAIVVWQDRRNGIFEQTYAQRFLVDATYAPGWPAEGLPLSGTPSSAGTTRHDLGAPILTSSVVPDGEGGVVVVWTDYRDSSGTGAGDIYAQRVRGDATFAAGWSKSGVAVCIATGDQKHPTIVPDGAGGAFIAWQDARGAGYDIYAQHVTGSGTPAAGWPANGLAVCTAPGDQETPAVAADGSGGAIVAWVDRRSGVPKVYGARISPDGVVPTLVSLVSAEAGAGFARLTWSVRTPEEGPVRIYRRQEETPWSWIGSASPDAEGRIVYEDRDVAPGRYGYRIAILSSGEEQFFEEEWVEIPGLWKLALEPSPNPVDGPMSVSFTLPSAERAGVDLLDVAGRRLESHSIDPHGAGRYQLRLGEVRGIASGVYVVRLTQGGRWVSRRACVVR